MNTEQRIAALERRVSVLEMMIRQCVVRAPGSQVIPVVMTQVGGLDGSDVLKATWTYDVKDLAGNKILTATDPDATPNEWERPAVGMVKKATFGLAYRTAGDTSRWSKTERWAIAWCNEIPEYEACV